MPRWGQFSLVLLFLLAGNASNHAEKETATDSFPAAVSSRSPEAAVRLNGLIRLDVTVTDQEGYSIGLLRRDNFTILDNGQPQKIVAFEASSDESAIADSPITVVVLLDMLDVPPEMAAFEREQTTRFLRRNNGFLLRPVTLYSLDNRGLTRIADASPNGNLLADALALDAKATMPSLPQPLLPGKLERAWEQHPPLKAIQAVGMIATEQFHVPGRKLLLWVGSGLNDWGSGAYVDTSYYYRAFPEPNTAISDPALGLHLFEKICWFSKLLREARLSVDTFSLGEGRWALTQSNWGMQEEAWKKFTEGTRAPPQASLMDLYKKVLAVESGGQVVPDKDENLAKQMDECVQRLAVFYTLTIDPPVAAGNDEYHSLTVKIARPGLTAHTSTGYYDQPYYKDGTGAAVRKMNVTQLQQMLQADSKRETAQELPRLVLSERLDSALRATLRAQVRRGEAREQFDAMADESQFLAPSPAKVVFYPPPDPAEQRQMLSAADRFLGENTARLPNFLATRGTVTLSETAGLHEFETTIKARPFHVEQKFDAAVSYQHGAEVVKTAEDIGSPDSQPLWTTGTFGPLLRTTLQAAMNLRDGVRWIRWEQGPDGRRAVFGFAVPANRAGSLRVDGCCLPDEAGNTRWGIVPGFHGEVTINAATGAIWRVQVEADLNQFVPVKRSGLIVTYGPVQIGGGTHILPLHAISLWRGREVVVLYQGDLSFKTWGPYETRINEFTFNHYRMFRGEARLLPGYTRLPADPSQAGEPTH